MADIQFRDLGNGRDRRDIVVGKAMAGMRLDPVPGSERSHVGDAPQFVGARRTCTIRIAPCVELHDRRTQDYRRFHLRGRGLDEQADPDTRRTKRLDHRRQGLTVPVGIESTLGGALLPPLGHDTGGVRAVAQRDLDHLVGRRHLQIERQLNGRHQPGDVRIRDMAPVLAQMRGDAVGAGARRQFSRAQRIGMVAAARIAHGGDMIDVDAQAKLGAHAAARLPGLIAGIA